MQELRLRIFDLEQRLLPRSPLGENSPIRIVQIDDESVGKYGQWPWPRTLVAKLVDRIAEGHPSVLGIDILFSAPDQTSPPVLAKELPDLPAPLAEALAQLPSNESRLAEAIAKVPTVLGLELTDRQADTASPKERGAADGLPQYSAVVQSVPAIAETAQAFGSITVEPDVDGVFRRLSLAARYHQTLVPGFAAAILAASKGQAPLPRLRPGGGGIEIIVGSSFLPADAEGAAWVYFARNTLFYSASDILGGAADPAQLGGKIVLLAVTRAGADLQRRLLLTDHGPIPYDFLVLATGAQTDFFGNESVARSAFGLKGLDWKVEFFLFCILVAVGQDYNIFIVSRILEESKDPAFAGPDRSQQDEIQGLHLAPATVSVQ